MNYILGKKVKMSQIWQDDKIVPVTIIEALPNKVSLVRTKDKDGYEAVQLSLGKTKKEFRVKETPEIKAEDEVKVSVFKEGDVVAVSGHSKGRGFAGVVKRHGFHGGPKTHGQKNRHRAPGSIGWTAAQRVIPGRKMAGHMGTNRVTTKNLKVAAINEEGNLIMIKGAVPGARGSLIEIRSVK
jgi:large subunit ribosomal protein L3